MLKISGVFPAISHGYMVAPKLLHSLETGKTKGNPYPLHFKKTKKEREKLATEKANWKKSDQRKRWARKEFYTHETYTF